MEQKAASRAAARRDGEGSALRGRLSLRDLEAAARVGAIDTVVISGVDIQGRLFGKRTPARYFLEHAHNGIHTSAVNLAWDIEQNLIQGFELADFHNGYIDMFTVPDMSTLRYCSWHPRTAWVLTDSYLEDGSPVEQLPRRILQRQVERAQALGYSAMFGSEVEFFLFHETPDSARAKGYVGLTRLGGWLPDYSIYRSSLDEWFLGPLRRHLEDSDIPVEFTKGEYGLGQVEVNLRPAGALEMADRHALYKEAVREIAVQHGLVATFMAKYDQQSGSSCHTHQSLWDSKERPVFWDVKAKHGLSQTMRHYLGGLQALVGDLFYFWMPNVNSYKRMGFESFAPIHNTYGGDTRTVSFRIVGHGDSFRIESRIPGADVNPYLSEAAFLAAGLYGIEHKLEPIGPFHEGNAYREAPEAELLPKTLPDAVRRLERSKVARELFGDAVIDHLLVLAHDEINRYFTEVTDWERRRNFEQI